MNADYPKRITRETARIRRVAESLPVYQRHALLNAVDRIELASRQQSTQHTPSGMETHDEIVDRYASVRLIIAALLNGEAVSFHDAARFHTAEFHTRIVNAREKLRKMGYALQSEWRRGRNYNYKLYWLDVE